MAGSQTRWDADRRMWEVRLDKAVPDGEDLEGGLRNIHNVVSASLDRARRVLTVGLHNEQDIAAVEDCLRRLGYLQTSRWSETTGRNP